MQAIKQEGKEQELIQVYANINQAAMRPHYRRAPELKPDTPDEFVKIINANPRLIESAQAQLAAKNLSLFDICKNVTDPNAVKNMFMNTELMKAIKQEGKEQELIQAHAQIYHSMWPDYRRAQPVVEDRREEAELDQDESRGPSFGH